MSDIVGDIRVRLQAFVAMSEAMGNDGIGSKLAAEAAATIERLTRELDECRASWRKLDDTANEWADRAHQAEAELAADSAALPATPEPQT